MQLAELKSLYELSFFDLLKKAREVHEENWAKNEVQLCTLLSIKTGGCSEDCSYCSQSAHYNTEVDTQTLMEKEEILKWAQVALDSGSTRFCMGAAWKGLQDGTEKFDKILDIVESVSELGMEVCTTLGELGEVEAKKLKEAGVTAYNHNIDTSPEHYPEIVTSHTFQDRLNTVRHVQDAGMSVCCGGIIGLGETTEDRLKMLEVLSNFNPQPESVPINSLVPIPGTPMADEAGGAVDNFEIVRMIALARIATPKAKVRLSAGRAQMSEEMQTLCFFAGANSIFYGEKLLTTDNPQSEADLALLKKLGMSPQKPNRSMQSPSADEERELSPAMT